MNQQISFINRMDGLPDEDIKDVASGSLDTDWSPPSFFPEHYKQAEVISIDLETKDPNLMTLGPGWCRDDGHVIGYAIAFNDFCGYYPIRHEGGGNLPEKAVLSYIAEVMATDIPKVMHNAQYDLGWMRWEGIEVNGPIYDTMTAAAMLNENRRWYNLNSLAIDYLNESKNERAMKRAAADYGVDPKAEMYKLPSRFVGEYAEQDARVTLRLWERLQAEMVKEEVTSIFALESQLTRLLVDMRWKGVRVDLDKTAYTQTQLEKQEQKLLRKIKKETNVEVEPWNPRSIAKLFDSQDLKYPVTEKSGAPSFTKQFLAAHPHPMAKNILKLREYNKANTTFIESILKFQNKGRIHAEFHPLRSDDGGTVTGRFSSSNLNLQQIPARDPEIKSLIRGLFVPEEGERWYSFDYSSQEPRWLAHYCATLTGANRHPQIDGVVKAYQDGDADFHQMVADMANISRKDAKTVNLGIMYGMGVGKLAGVLDITTDEAKQLLAEYNEKVPFVKGLANAVQNKASEDGVIRTILGRKCRFDMWEPRRYGLHRALPLKEAIKEHGPRDNIKRAFTYKALNRLIQGSSADQTKKAMVDLNEQGIQPLLTVHDELCFSLKDDKMADTIVDTMENCIETRVPFKVDKAVGDNWGEID